MTCHRPYLPLGALKPVAPEVWIIDGPEIGMRFAGLQVSFPTRATVIRTPGGLWVHSPVALDDALAAQLDAIGEVRFLIAPNALHFSWVSAWKGRWPAARAYAAPGLRRRRGIAPDLFDKDLTGEPPPAWGGLFRQWLIQGDVLTEVVFLHRPSRTLVLTDLIQNYEPDRVCPHWRWLIRLSGCADPDGKAPWDMQLSFLRSRAALRAAVEQMIASRPERVLLAHGRPYLANGAAELRRAFQWVL